MISEQTISSVIEQSDILEIISMFIDLKKSGSSFRGKSPFSEEKTPSFYVVPSKNIFKDFSSGIGGGVIKFLMQSQGMDFRQAIKFLADHYSIEVLEEDSDPQYRERNEKVQYITSLNHAAQIKYSDKLNEIRKGDPDSRKKYWDQINRFSEDQICQWQIGIATEDDKFIYSFASEKGKVQDCIEAGLIGYKQGYYFDSFRERILFPIHDKFQRIVGFGGRTYSGNPAKYLNTRETDAFKKDRILYGLPFAQKSIKNGIEKYDQDQEGNTTVEKVLSKTAILQEGYTDVIAFHEVGITNTVATLGTGLSEHHCRELKYLADTIILMRDGDEAGMRAAEKDTKLLIKKGFKVRVALLPEKTDPEEFAKELGDRTLNWVIENHQDALLFFAKKLYEKSNDPYEKSDAIDQVASMILSLPDTFIQEEYRKSISKALKLTVSRLRTREEEKKEKEIAQNNVREKNKTFPFEGDNNLPDEVDLEKILRVKFFSKVDHELTGYYMLNDNMTGFQKVSNFTMTPILHKYDPEDNSRILKLENGLDEAEIIEIPSDSLVSAEKFRTNLINRGPYHWFGTKNHLDRITGTLLREFPKGYELKTLGWQNEGFFAYYNGCFVPEDGNGYIQEYNEAGLVQVNKRWYFSPASSKIFQDERKDNDQFEKDRQLFYQPVIIRFEEWCQKMHEAYGMHSFSGIPFVLISLFKDVVYSVDNNCPHLYAYGESKSGKSKFGESVANAFFKDLKPFSMSSGTDAAFAATLDRFRNCPMLFNEFDESVVKEERFQAVKTAFDGEGRERLGGGANKKRSNTQKVNVTMILMGQFISTKDDNSVIGRSILENFKLTHNRPEKQTKAYNELKYLEKKGIGGLITELLPFRKYVEKEYYEQFHYVFKTLSARIRDKKRNYDERVLRNYTALCTMVRIFSQWFQFPFTEDEYMDWAEEKITMITRLMSESDIIKDFWITVQILRDENQIFERKHFKIVEERRIRVDEPDTSDGYLDLGCQTRLLYIRLAEVHKAYLKETKKEGNSGINISSLASYIKSRTYFKGYVRSADIGGNKYSCYILEYDKLGINIHSSDPNAS